jgi:hypothetical protein
MRLPRKSVSLNHSLKNLLVLFLTIGFAHQAFALCEVMVHHYERQHGIPDKLLMAIALVESGRSMPGRGFVPWPWTINARGKPYVFKTKYEAINKVKELQRRGIRSIDVGCMQVNLKHHPRAFKNLEEAFDPAKNIAYAAKFLREKMHNAGSWYRAIAHYHSGLRVHNLPYKNRVLRTWAQVHDYQPITPVFARNHESGEFETHIHHTSGQRVSVQIRFAPYTGF